ncbi:MAG TPA: hypothetical protein PK280_09435 [Planctomycetota bacterium]|nr:hypothetical protein [Planctomycetota bacterium]
MSEAPAKFAVASLWVGRPTSLATDAGRTLVLTPGEFTPYSFSFGIRHKGEEVDLLSSLVRLVDDQGRIWEYESIWTVEEVVTKMTDFGSTSAFVRFDDAPLEWKIAFDEDSFFSGARGLLDDRFYRHLHLGDQALLIPFHYQAPILDMAFHVGHRVDLTMVLARVSGLYACETSEGPRITLPPIVFEVGVDNRLFVNHWYKDSTGSWDQDILPQPLLFRLAGGSGQPNPLIKTGEV